MVCGGDRLAVVGLEGFSQTWAHLLTGFFDGCVLSTSCVLGVCWQTQSHVLVGVLFSHTPVQPEGPMARF